MLVSLTSWNHSDLGEGGWHLELVVAAEMERSRQMWESRNSNDGTYNAVYVPYLVVKEKPRILIFYIQMAVTPLDRWCQNKLLGRCYDPEWKLLFLGSRGHEDRTFQLAPLPSWNKNSCLSPSCVPGSTSMWAQKYGSTSPGKTWKLTTTVKGIFWQNHFINITTWSKNQKHG